MQAPVSSHTAIMKQKLAGSSTPDGNFAQLPTCPGIAHDWQEPVHVEAQVGGG